MNKKLDCERVKSFLFFFLINYYYYFLHYFFAPVATFLQEIPLDYNRSPSLLGFSVSSPPKGFLMQLPTQPQEPLSGS